MKKWTIAQIIEKIENEELFEAQPRDESFQIKIETYVPYVCAAIHDGHGFRKELEQKSLLSDYERWYEEDPHTLDFINYFPITLAGKDSRFEYDLNRPPEEAVYETAWGKEVWKTPLTENQKTRSLKKHENFYRVARALIQKLEEKFGSVVVYDMHSYNYRRWKRKVPVFNLGTKNIDPKFQAFTESFREELHQIKIPGIPSQAHENDTFFGNGYFLKHLSTEFKNTLVLATEVKKIYCDELTGISFPTVVEGLRAGLKQAILNHAHSFIKGKTSFPYIKKSELLSSNIEPALKKVDSQLSRLVRNFELLSLINPVNLETEKKRFLKNKYRENPKFRYKPLAINPFEMKRQLTKIPVEKIKDVDIQTMYHDVINAYIDKIDMLANIGSRRFLYNSLRYFGEPNHKDLRNAQFIMMCPDFRNEPNAEMVTEKEAAALFEKSKEYYDFDFKIQISNNLTSKALVLNSKKTVLLKKGVKFSQRMVDGLVEHEIGVHMVTTMNANMQPLRIFSIGLPVNTKTQEGLAVLSEYLSDNIDNRRLKEIAIRVLAVDSMVEGNDFKTTFAKLVEQYHLSPEDAFYLNTRVYRGGGFTKDFLYLRGLRIISQNLKQGRPMKNLLIGKTSIEYLDTIDEMIDRGMVIAPKYYTKTFAEYDEKKYANPILNYVLDGLV